MTTLPSPGNDLFPNGPLMRQPSLAFLYRLECDIAKEEINIGAPHDAGVIRSIANIVRGSVKGPGIEGSILPLGGADWATVVKGTHVRLQEISTFEVIILTKAMLVHDPRCSLYSPHF